ncbi:unnamed protein product [Parascedosporium putredinis]|uniref:FAD-binding domain-containing protein n=1 Tax=Parascedosporium putredinis TaxID=1442378 RepID=A0A9P1MFX6_9PEZI|nr:unnamed protein product [Parascedosporium putredinis]CAI8004338.1 unnamed protein product [Parascedosporium putredinis]
MCAAESFHITIVGGGIAGLITAIALRGENRHITILERSRMLHETGALISLQPNASKIITSWGIDKFLEFAEPMNDRCFRMISTAGKSQDLHSGLKNAATSTALPGKPVNIRTSAAVKSCDADAGSVTLEDGETITADLVIGADGIHSKIREAVIGEYREAIPTGISAYRMLIPIESLQDINIPATALQPADPVTTMVIGHEKRVIMGPGRGQALWHRRTILIGDAAHPMLPTQGQGASQSVEDAEALKAFFSTAQSKPSLTQIDDALLKVIRARKERASLIQTYSRQQAKPGTSAGSQNVTLNPGQFMKYNCDYHGAQDWLDRQDQVNA